MIHLIDISKRIDRPHQPTVHVLDRVSASIDTTKIVSVYGNHVVGLSAFLQIISGILRPDKGRVIRQGIRLSPLMNADNTAGATQFGMMTLLETIRWHSRINRLDEDMLLGLVDNVCDISNEIKLPIYAIEWPKRRGIEIVLISAAHFDCYLIDRFDQIQPRYRDFILEVCRFRETGLLFTCDQRPSAASMADETIELSAGCLNYAGGNNRIAN